MIGSCQQSYRERIWQNSQKVCPFCIQTVDLTIKLSPTNHMRFANSRPLIGQYLEEPLDLYWSLVLCSSVVNWFPELGGLCYRNLDKIVKKRTTLLHSLYYPFHLPFSIKYNWLIDCIIIYCLIDWLLQLFSVFFLFFIKCILCSK